MSPRIENLILAARIKLDLTNQDVAKSMSTALNRPVSKETAGHYFTGTSGIPVANLGAFLSSLQLKIVPENQPEISPERLSALQTLAREALEEGE